MMDNTEDDDTSDDTDDPWNFHKCKYKSCGFRTSYLHVILRHVRQHKRRPKSHRFVCHMDSPQKYQCKKCQFQSHLKIILTKHNNAFHKREETPNYLRPVHHCETCDFRTYSSLILLNHECSKKVGKTSVQTSHNKNEPPGSDEEKKSSNPPKHQQNTLKNIGHHETNHCSDKATEMGDLQKHVLRKGTTLKQINGLECKDCPYKAQTNENLKRHVLTQHTQPAKQDKLKRFKCDRCAYKTSRRNKLKRHLLFKHTPSKQINWHKCVYCTYKTKLKSNLNKHLLLTQHSQPAESRSLNASNVTTVPTKR